jgi:hypothetical protein
MVKFALPLIALATAAALASPAGAPFSFSQWVEDIIAHPDTALTVDEAIAAARAAHGVGSAGELTKRSLCELDSLYGIPRAPVRGPETLVSSLGGNLS